VNNLVHDNVNYVPCLKLSAAKAQYERLRAEQREALANGKLRGIGIACYAELTGLGTSTAVGPGTLLQPGRDAVTLRLETTGVLTVAAALPSQGQRIITALRQVAADELGMRLSDITSLTNDTATAPYGFGTLRRGPRCSAAGPSFSARELRRRILALGGLLLQASADELTIVDSVIQTLDRSRSMPLREMAEHSYFSAKHIPPELNPGFEVTSFTTQNSAASPAARISPWSTSMRKRAR
jgi:carbon-monoxide dehydrogenase large subunit